MKIRIVLTLLALSACSLTSKTPNAALTNALVNVSATYLRYVVIADEAKLGNVILWHDHLEANNLDKESYLKKLRRLKKRYPTLKNHPLLGLEVQDIEWNENRAVVTLAKAGKKNSTTIVIDLYWGSNSWLVVDDNIFGQGELLDVWLQK